jgi:hypothetical protein
MFPFIPIKEKEQELRKNTTNSCWIFLFFGEIFSITHLTQNEQNEEARDFEKSINSKSAAIFY